MTDYISTEKDFWHNILSEFIIDQDPQKPYKLPVEPYWLSEAQPGDVFFFKDTDEVWQKCTVDSCVYDVVFYRSIPIDRPDLVDLYSRIQHMSIDSRANQHALLYREKFCTPKGDTNIYYSKCPYTEIIRL